MNILKDTKTLLSKITIKYLLLATPILIMFLLQLYLFHKLPFLLTGDDNIIHYYLIEQVVETGHISLTNFYPHLIHYFIGYLVRFSHLPIDLVFTSITIIVVSLAPFSTYYLTKILTKNEKIALTASFLSPLFYTFNLNIYIWGGFPFLWGLTFMNFYIGYFWQSLESRKVWRLFLSVLFGICLFLIHAPELVTSVIFLGCLCLGKPKIFKDKFFYLAIFINAIAFFLLYKFLNDRPLSEISASSMPFIFNSNFLLTLKSLWISSWYYFFITFNLSLILFFAVGSFFFIHHFKKVKEAHGVIIYFIVISLVFIDTVFLQKLSFFYKLFYPWADSGRFFPFSSFPIVFISAYGFLQCLAYWKNRKNEIYKNMLLYLALVFYFSPLCSSVIFIRSNIMESVPSQSILNASSWITENLKPETLILNDISWGYLSGEITYRPTDFAAWFDMFTPMKVAFPYFRQPEPEHFEKRFYILENINDLNNSQVRELLEEENINYVFWNSETFLDREHSCLQIDALLQNENLELLYSSRDDCIEKPEDNCAFIFEIH